MPVKNKSMHQLWHETRWIVLGLIWLASLYLGFRGFRQFAAQNGLPLATADLLYLTLQLVGLESGAVQGVSNWALNVARFLLPLLTAITALQAIKMLFREQLQWLSLWRIRDHVLVCGLGEKGRRLLPELLEAGHRVVAIEQSEVALSRVSGSRAILLRGDARDPEMLSRARLERASHIICLLGEDSHNLQLAVSAYSLVSRQQQRKRRLTCVIHLGSPELSTLAKGSELLGRPDVGFRLETFNPYARAARILMNEDEAWDPDGHSLPRHILIIGLGRLGTKLAVQAAYNWYKAKAPKKATISVIDRDSSREITLLRKSYPAIDDVCDVRPLDCELSLGNARRELTKIIAALQVPERIYVCLEDSVLAAQVCLDLLRIPALIDTHIFVRAKRDDALLEVLGNASSMGPNVSRVRAFDIYDRTCSAVLITGGTHEVLAQGLYASYVKGMGISYAQRPWDNLAEEEKRANRRQADRIGQLLATCGYVI
ncbi:MAG TPA: NAD(P)-binding protein, partial [Bacillota bacterium]|nr:NAD(P)-binding protein [Bacillota bacterium]